MPLVAAPGDVLGHVRRYHHDPFGVADHDVSRLHHDAAAPDRQAEVGRVMQDRAGRAVRAAGVGREVQRGDRRGITQRAVGHQSGHSALHQPRAQDVPERRGADLAPGVDDEHLIRPDGFHRDPLRVRPVVVFDLEVQVLPGGDVAQRELVSDHPLVGPQRPDAAMDVLRKPSLSSSLVRLAVETS